MYPDDEVISIEELKRFLVEHGDKVICVGCGRPLYHNWGVSRYPHDGGIRVKEDNSTKQWVYIHHTMCGYDMALWKMEQRLRYISKELYDEYINRVYVKGGRNNE